MANTSIAIRRTTVAGRVPNTTTMSTGTLALNMTDQILYSMDAANNVFIIGANTVTQRIDIHAFGNGI